MPADELTDLRRMFADLKAVMAGLPDWDAQQRNVETLESIDCREVGVTLVKDLVESFGHWRNPKMTGETVQRPLSAAYFEWSDQDFDYILAYGFQHCTPKRGRVFIPREEYDLGGSTFHDTGGVSCSGVLGIELDDPSTQCTDLQIFKVAEALHYGVIDAIPSPEFEALDKNSPLYFIAGRHDRWPALAYRWESP